MPTLFGSVVVHMARSCSQNFYLLGTHSALCVCSVSPCSSGDNCYGHVRQYNFPLLLSKHTTEKISKLMQVGMFGSQLLHRRSPTAFGKLRLYTVLRSDLSSRDGSCLQPLHLGSLQIVFKRFACFQGCILYKNYWPMLTGRNLFAGLIP